MVSSSNNEVFQSSLAWDGVPERAVDGGYSGDFWDLSCTHTAGQDDPWWAIDIGHTMLINKVVAYNRVDCCSDRTNGLTVVVSDTRIAGSDTETPGDALTDLLDLQECASLNGGASSEVMTFNCEPDVVGRYVYIYIPSNTKLTLCEVEVYAVEEPCTPTMNLIPNTSTRGATAFEEVQDREECIQLCMETEGCEALDYNFSRNPFRGRRCWLHLQPVTNPMKANRRVDHYQVIGC